MDNIVKAMDMVNQIKDSVDDDEHAHNLEDKLYGWVIDLLVEGADDARLAAIVAIQVRDLEFSRWYA